MYQIKRVSGHDEFVASLDKLERAELKYTFPGSCEYVPNTYAQMAHDDAGMWVHMHSDECAENLRGVVTEVNGQTFKDSCMEFFFIPDPENNDDRYYNFEINILGTVHIGFGSKRGGRSLIGNENSKRLHRVNVSIDADGWSLIFYVPFFFIAEHTEGFEPKKGMRFIGNIYKIGDNTPRPHYSMWNEIITDQPNYHCPQFFGDWIFE